jgi:hypothetical protein
VGVPIGTVGCSGMTDTSTNGNLRLAAFSGAYWSYLHLAGNIEPILYQYSAGAEIAWLRHGTTSYGLDAGVVLGGRFSYAGTVIDLDKGFVVSVIGMRDLLMQKGARPFGVLTFSVSASRTAGRKIGDTTSTFVGTDARVGFTVGYTLWHTVQVYLSPKVFGGPFFWMRGNETIRGNDRYFVQTGLGLSALLPAGFALFVNGSPLGEQVVSGGLAKTF